MAEDTTSQSFFESMYRDNNDPWNFATDEYELNRYGETLRALGTRHFERAFEPGCSIGILTEKLAQRCTRLEAMDISPTAVSLAAARCRDLPGVSIQVGTLPRDIPEGSFDLIVFSEIGYYLEESALRDVSRLLIGRLTAGGVFIAVHWLGQSEDHVLTGDRVHGALMETIHLPRKTESRFEGFRLDVWEKRP